MEGRMVGRKGKEGRREGGKMGKRGRN